MVKIYNTVGWIKGNFEILGRRADQPYPKAMLLKATKCLVDGSDLYNTYFCAERGTGSFEHLDFVSGVKTYATRDEAVAAARSQGFAL